MRTMRRCFAAVVGLSVLLGGVGVSPAAASDCYEYVDWHTMIIYEDGTIVEIGTLMRVCPWMEDAVPVRG